MSKFPKTRPCSGYFELYANAGLDNPDAWQIRIMTLDGTDERSLSRLHGRLIAAGWIEFNIAAARAKSETMRCYRITAAGRRALRRAHLDKYDDETGEAA